MNIIYLSSSCSDKKFNQLIADGKTRQLPQAQKYHNLLREGIVQNIDGNLYAISALPVNRTWTKQVYFAQEEEVQGKIKYIYSKFLNLPFLRQLTRIGNTKKEIKKILRSEGSFVIICDILNQSLAIAARKCGRKYGIPVIGIVTDVPGHTLAAKKKNISFMKKIVLEWAEYRGNKDMKKYDAYLLLTEEMNSVVNLDNKPYIVLEGHCDSKMQCLENSIKAKSTPKVIMYAGGIYKEYGIERLVNAFVRGHFDDWELHIYGDGNYKTDLMELTEKVKNVKYFGARPNSEIVENQLTATLLINPRLTDAEYVKYSFPSKTMECMVSGTPLLTTKLPGMPTEYYQYVYLFDDETENGMLCTLEDVLGRSEVEYHRLGMKAKQFMLNEKTNTIQAKKLMDFINKISLCER